jgi:uncharacterized membrane protein YdjX (TVP38/TMEM64 family)
MDAGDGTHLDELMVDAAPDARRGLLPAALWVAMLVALVLAVRLTPLRAWADPERLAALAAPAAHAWWGPLLSVGLFVAGSFLLVPYTLLVVQAGALHGPWVGLATALAGGLLATAANFGVGHLAGRPLLRRLGGPRLARVSRRLARGGVLAVVALRLVPVAPFGVVNVVAGATHVKLGDFLVGSAIGYLPGVVALTVLGDRLAAVWRHPTPASAAALAALGAALLAGLAVVPRLVRRLGRGGAAGP